MHHAAAPARLPAAAHGRLRLAVGALLHAERGGYRRPLQRRRAVSVAVGPVSIPAIVDRPQFVVSTGPNEVRVDEFNRWAAPLADDISRVVAEDLVVLLGTPRVTLYPQQAADAQYRVSIGVQRFESTVNEAALLDAQWSVRRTHDGLSQSGRTTLTEAATASGYDALAAAHSRALSRLSYDIAQAVRALEAVPAAK